MFRVDGALRGLWCRDGEEVDVADADADTLMLLSFTSISRIAMWRVDSALGSRFKRSPTSIEISSTSDGDGPPFRFIRPKITSKGSPCFCEPPDVASLLEWDEVSIVVLCPDIVVLRK